MDVFEIISGIVLLITGLVLIAVILMQRGKGRGLGSAIDGGGNVGNIRGARTIDAMLARWTKICAVVLMIVTLAVNLVVRFMK